VEGTYAIWDDVDLRYCETHVSQFGSSEYILQYQFNQNLNNAFRQHLGARWNPGLKKWTIEKTARALYGLSFLSNGEARKRYYQLLPPEVQPRRSLKRTQQDLLNETMFKCGVLGAHDMGLGKTLAAIEIMEQTYYSMPEAMHPLTEWFFWVILPKGLISTWKNELKKWGSPIKPKFIVNSLASIKSAVASATFVPRVLVIDEIAEFRRPSQRTAITAALTNKMFVTHGLFNCQVLGLSGQPAPRDLADYYYPIEIVRPGFLKEHKHYDFDRRLSVYESMTGDDGSSFPKRMCWKTGTCAVCNGAREEHPSLNCAEYYQRTLCKECNKLHLGRGCGKFRSDAPDIDEVSLLYQRIAPVVLVERKDPSKLPEIEHVIIQAEPTPELLEYAELVLDTCTSKLEVIRKLRQLSDGFLYPEEGEAVLMPQAPKLEAYIDYMSARSPRRTIIFSSNTASIDLLCGAMQRLNYTVIRIDGRGTRMISRPIGQFKDVEDYFSKDTPEKIAIVGHPTCLSMGWNLQVAKLVAFYSNGDRNDHRTQGIARAWRDGASMESITLVDFLCLGIDRVVMTALMEKRDAETITLDEVKRCLGERRQRNSKD